MKKKFLFVVILLAICIMNPVSKESEAAVSVQVGTPNLSFSINDYQPPPPNVQVQNDNGKPYYIERDRRVYMEKKHHKKHHKKEKKHHENHGRGNGHDGREDRDGDRR